jgi:transposase
MVATEPVDFRKGHDGLAALVKNELHKDPFTGTVFVFRSRKADRLKLIYWDGSGLVMAYKRLEEHTFTWPGIKDGLISLGHAQFEAQWMNALAGVIRTSLTNKVSISLMNGSTASLPR